MPTPTPTTDVERATALVLEGWTHLQLQRPLAAWGSWQRALRVAPGLASATEALDRLEAAADLPAAARATYRFRNPADEGRRARWDEALRGRDLAELDRAAEAFAALANADPADAAARFNHALCLAWLGRNAEAIDGLDRVTRLLAGPDPERAAEAWTLAEVLRQGAGAEAMADDLNYAWTAAWSEADTARLLAGRPEIHPLPPLRDPAGGPDPVPDARVFEWLDRPMPDAEAVGPDLARVPRLLATVVITGRSIRLSSPDPRTLEETREALALAMGDPPRPVRREVSPLPLGLLDAAVWTVRLPRGLGAEAERSIGREAVEAYYETRWIHQARQGLGGLTPLEAGRLARGGDLVARARLEGVVRLREQLGARPRTAGLYHGYPFDRLRRRLGLAPVDPETVGDDDPGCMGGEELDALDPAALDDLRLAEAFTSASALGEDSRTARFAAELVRREAAGLGRLPAPALFAPLVREAMGAGDAERALGWLERARALNGGRDRRTFDVWIAEIHAREGRPGAAAEVYEALLAEAPDDAALALDAAETLLDNGAEAEARPFLLRARDAARRAGDRPKEERAADLLGEG